MAKYVSPALITVGGVDLPEPSTYDPNTATVVDGGRNANAKFIGDVVRDDMAKVSVSWKFLEVSEWSKILKLFKLSSGGKFVNTVTFFDQTEGTYMTREMYVSDRKAGMWRRDPNNFAVMGWTDCKLELIEV